MTAVSVVVLPFQAVPLTVLQAQEGVRALASALPRIVRDPGDLDARAEALLFAAARGELDQRTISAWERGRPGRSGPERTLQAQVRASWSTASW